VYSEDGQFAEESALLGSYDPCRLTVKVQRVDQKLVEQVKVNYPGTPLPEGTALEFQTGRKNVRDLVLTPVEGGFAYDFTAQGHGFVKLQIRATRQTGTVILYPDENYHYSGTVMVPHIYNASNVYVTLRSGKGSGSIATGQTTKGYALKAKETESAPEGRLKGVIVCVDPGHQNAPGGEREPLGPGMDGYGSNAGGMAEGTVTRRRESIVMLECGFVIRDELLRQGATVVMTREIEEKRYSNLERDAVANDAGAHVMLRLHGDNNKSDKNRGFGIYYPVPSEYALAVADTDTYRSYGQALLDALQTRKLGSINKATLDGTDRFVGNNWAKMPCFLIELGFMSNVQDDILLSTPAHQQDLAEGLAEGVWLLMVERGVVEP
jgi:N-acetylmuramoyl-L-alanine amidase